MNETATFSQISTYPTQLNTGTILARMVEGIGFKYFWATEGLTESDLAYSPGNENRTLLQTLDHMYNMLDFTGYVLEGKTYPFPETENGWTFAVLRDQTLKRIAKIQQHLLSLEDQDLNGKSIHLTMNEQPMEFPIWHLFNGPLIDFMSHLGQVVVFRRANHNPIDPYVQPFMGQRIVA